MTAKSDRIGSAGGGIKQPTGANPAATGNMPK